jgi:hypothetical protein
MGPPTVDGTKYFLRACLSLTNPTLARSEPWDRETRTAVQAVSMTYPRTSLWALSIVEVSNMPIGAETASVMILASWSPKHQRRPVLFLQTTRRTAFSRILMTPVDARCG